MAYEMGRTLTGYEVQKVLAAVDWFEAARDKLKIGVIGYGDGGMIALYAAALDERIQVVRSGWRTSPAARGSRRNRSTGTSGAASPSSATRKSLC